MHPILILLWIAACAQPVSAPPQPPQPAPASRPAPVDQTAAPEEIQWLESRSILHQARGFVPTLAGKGRQWRHPYAAPQPHAVVRAVPVWVLAYPGSVMTRPGQSVVSAWGDEHLWKTFDDIGISLLHTGPVKRAGGLSGRRHTPTIDGWFDPIALEIDPALGTDDDYRQMVRTAAAHHGRIAGDLVPLHTGKGADFQLALRAYRDYPGMYVMVEIEQADWGLLPPVDDPEQTALVSPEVAARLMHRGYIPGSINSCDADPDVRRSSGWSATGSILGVDGKTRRWVYLHFFKPGQPVLNWLDPSCAAQRAVAADLVQTMEDFGAQVVRLDAVPFLGIEPRNGSTLTDHFQHPLSILGTNYLAFLSRRMGGWSFQELNVPLDSLKEYMKQGPDLSYDFFTRSEGLHALLMQDAALLRLAFGFLLEADVQPVCLVHDLQNHDEITYQLVILDALGDKELSFQGGKISARRLREQTLNEMRARAAGPAAPYNLLYRPTRDGLATTYAGFIAASLGIADLNRITAEQKRDIQQGHLLLAHLNAMQPGVFSLSGWDLVGALPLPRAAVEARLADGDFRWINRGGIDLLGDVQGAAQSAFGLPVARALYGPLPTQLKDPTSFAAQLKNMLASRKRHRISDAVLLDVPDVTNSSLCLLIMRPAEGAELIITALNFSRTSVDETLDLSRLKSVKTNDFAGQIAVNCLNDTEDGRVQADGKLTLLLEGWSGKTVVIRPARR